jgi:SAM-dependent methyltransferase
MRKRDIRILYKFLLNRDPENELVLRDKAKRLSNLEVAMNEFTSSDEYQAIIRPLNLLRDRAEVEISQKNLDLLFQQVEFQWSRLGEQDPFWSVISDNKFSIELFGKYEQEFWESGCVDIDLISKTLKRYNIELVGDSLFELGCGVGRLTKVLSSRFAKVTAVDISKNHLDIAKKVTSNSPNITFQHLQSISRFNMEPHDVFISLISLQHNPPPVQYKLLDHIMKSTRRLAVFQICAASKDYSFMGDLKDLENLPTMDMHIFPPRALFEMLSKYGWRVLEIELDGRAGPNFLSWCIYAIRDDSNK